MSRRESNEDAVQPGNSSTEHPSETVAKEVATNTNGPVQPIETVRTDPAANSEEAQVVTANNQPNLQQSGQPLQLSVDQEQYEKFLEWQKQQETAQAAESQDVVEDKVQESTEACWNCANHGKHNTLDVNGHCSVCGFEKDKLFNGNIEAERARQRHLAEFGY